METQAEVIDFELWRNEMQMRKMQQEEKQLSPWIALGISSAIGLLCWYGLFKLVTSL